MQGLVVGELEAEEHVRGGDRMPVRERRALPQVKRPGEAVGADLPALGKPRCILLRLVVEVHETHEHRLPVMSVDEVSFAIIALKVLGPVVSPRMKRPP